MDSDQMTDGGTKNYFKIAAATLVVLVMLAAAWHWGRPAYRHHKVARNLAEAQAAFNRGDYPGAVLRARLVLLLNSNSVPACRIMAGVAEAAHSPATLDWWQKIANLDPTVENKLAQAAAALQFQNPPFPLTTQILGELPDTATNLTGFHIVATLLAMRMNHLADAEIHMAAASRLEPTNQSFQLNLAVLHLNSTNPAVVNAACETLNEFRTNASFGPTALRSLVSERLVRNDVSGALAYSTQLLANAQSNQGDRLQYLGILKRLQSPDLVAQLKSVQQAAATNAMLAAQTASWMEANGFMAETITWLGTLSTNIQSQPAVQLALVDYYMSTTNWQGLCRITAKGDWDEMNFLRLAFSSHAWNKLGEQVVADANWRSAVDAAGDRLGALNSLLNLAGRWEMASAQEDLLWRMVRYHPDAAWAQQNLEQLYLSSGNTRKLYQLYSSQFPRLPQNAQLKNNLAATALLLKTNFTQACQWAAEVYAQRTNDPAIVSTYAYAQHLQGRDSEGLAAMQKLKLPQLEEPSVALYYGVLLSAVGKSDEAAPYLQIARSRGQLLPEEKRLLAELAK